MKRIRNKFLRVFKPFLVGGASLLLSACSVNGYKDKWDCGVVKGMGCSSMTMADEVARKQIILNTETEEGKGILIEEHYDDFKLVRRGYQSVD
jgi:hypothetical protein